MPLYNCFKKYSISIKSNQKVRLPIWTTSAIRGAIGTQLLKNNCPVPNNPVCGTCPLITSCSAGILFKSSNMQNASNITSPYIFYSPIRKDEYTDTVEFDLTLFGDAVKVYDEIIDILTKGIKLSADRHEFYLSDSTQVDVDFDYAHNCDNRLKIGFVTPYKYKAKGRDLNFEYLIRGTLRRLTNIYKLCNKEFDADFNTLIKKSKDVVVKDTSLSLENYERYSNRTNKKMNAYGVIGNIEFEGDISEFVQYIYPLSYIHIGKMTTMGFGKVEIIV